MPRPHNLAPRESWQWPQEHGYALKIKTWGRFADFDKVRRDSQNLYRADHSRVKVQSGASPRVV